MASFALSLIPASKLVLGAPLYGYDWRTDTNAYVDRMWDEFPALATTYSATPVMDSTEREKRFTYTAGAVPRSVWYQDAETLAERADIVRAHNISGMHFWRAGGEDPATWNAIRQALHGTNLGPFTAQLMPVKDTTIDAADTDNHRGQLDELFVKSSLERRALLHFDLNFVPDGATITSATLRLTRKGFAGTEPGGRTYQCYRLTQPGWTETVNGNPATDGATWARYDEPSSAWTAAGGDFTTTGGATATVPGTNGSPMDFNVLTLVQDAIASRGDQLHLLIKDSANATNHQTTFHSKESGSVNLRPLLLITWTP